MCDVTNYRPISILSTIPKLFESLVLDNLLPQILPLIIPHQHGFLPRMSVSSNLLCYLNYISQHVHNSQVDSVYLDLTKAFDRVNHRILLDKLSSYGISGPFLSWFSSYLSDRHCMVRLGSSISSSFPSTSGVPQGSHLGPILFLLFINDVLKCLSVHDVQFLLFCDDLKIFREVRSSNDFNILQNALDHLKLWFDSNLLEVNTGKCNVISFTRSLSPHLFDYSLGPDIIPRSTCVRDLGVLFDSKLSFNPHMDAICTKASKMLGFIFRSTKDFPDPLSFKILYCSLVRSILEFSSSIWNPSYNYYSGRIESIQHKALNILNKKQRCPDSSYSSLEREFNLLSLSKRRDMFDMIFFFNILHSHLPVPDLLSSVNINLPGYTTRDPLPFMPQFVRTSYLQNSPMVRFQRSANSLRADIDFFSTSVSAIREYFSSH